MRQKRVRLHSRSSVPYGPNETITLGPHTVVYSNLNVVYLDYM